MQDKGHRKIWEKILRPGGKAGFAVSLFSTLLFILLANFLAYQYLSWQSPSTAIEGSKWGWAFGTVTGFAGIKSLESPVDTILLGDSVCKYNLDDGPFADRLGGRVMNLGNINETSFLMDAWMLGDYIDRFGPPKNVVVSRSSPWGYVREHNVEFMAVVPLPWGYWDRYGTTPTWQDGEIRNLLITRYGTLYSDADILRDRLLKPWKMFSFPVKPILPSREYTRGSTDPGAYFDVGRNMPSFYFGDFVVSADTDTAIRYMSNLARSRHFQLYFAFQPEWDEAIYAGSRTAILSAQISYLNQYTDPTYVHILRDPLLTFSKEQMESPNHLRPAADRIFTESHVEDIVAMQNKLTSSQPQELRLGSAGLDKSWYQIGERPVINLSIINFGGDAIEGGVSCLVRREGQPDREWLARAPSTDLSLPPGGQTIVSLEVSVGGIDKAGTYDLIIFLRQNVGNLSHETRIELKSAITVNN